MLVDRFFCRWDAEPLGEGPYRPQIGGGGGDVRPLRRILAFREEAAKLVEGRRWCAQDPVRVLVDECDRAQYFRK